MPQRFSDAEIMAAYEQAGTKIGAARELGLDLRGFQRRLARIEGVEARKGWAPDHGMTKTVPEGFLVKGVSTLYGDEGEIRAQWVKSVIDNDRQREIIAEAVEAMCQDLPRLAPAPAPDATLDSLLAVYPMGDPHIGMLSWGEETGADFDLEIAERDLCAAMAHLVSQAPAAKRALIANLGDFFHADNMQGTTSRSGNVLDMDSRLPKMVRVGVKVMRQLIQSALEKHETVEVVNAIGNHDDVLSMALSIMLANIYEAEPRVIIHDQPTPRHYIRHGKVLIGITHGHTTKDRDLPLVMATERSKEWGETLHRFWYRGHHHHDAREEFNGCTVEQMRTLAAGDAYAVSHGYLSGRDMKCIVHHAEYGEVARTVCGIDMLR